MFVSINWRNRLWCALLAHVLLASALRGQSAEPTWQLLDGDCQIRVLQHVRTSQPACDNLRFVAGHGTETYACVNVPSAAVIPELKVEVPVCADRPGLQVLARVVLPRSINPATRGPYTLLIAGGSYKTRTNWQSLVLEHIPQNMERRIRVLQLETAQPLDAREAYIDMVLVNLYGGPGRTEVQLGDAQLEGAAETGPSPRGLAVWSVSHARTARTSLSGIRLSGDLLLVNGQPFLARMFDDNGEDWKYLSGLGINTVRLATPASVEQMALAESLDMWIVCPPPLGTISTDSAIHWRRVLGWDLSKAISAVDPEQALHISQFLRRRDGLQLPVLCESARRAALAQSGGRHRLALPHDLGNAMLHGRICGLGGRPSGRVPPGDGALAGCRHSASCRAAGPGGRIRMPRVECL